MSINGTEKSERSGSPVDCWDPNGLDFVEQVRVGDLWQIERSLDHWKHLVNYQNQPKSKNLLYSYPKNANCSNPRADNSTRGSSAFGSAKCLDKAQQYCWPIGQDQKLSVSLLDPHFYQLPANKTETFWLFPVGFVRTSSFLQRFNRPGNSGHLPATSGPTFSTKNPA